MKQGTTETDRRDFLEVMLQLPVPQYRSETTIRDFLNIVANRNVTTTTCTIGNWGLGETQTSLQQVLLLPQPIIPKQYYKIKSKLLFVLFSVKRSRPDTVLLCVVLSFAHSFCTSE